MSARTEEYRKIVQDYYGNTEDLDFYRVWEPDYWMAEAILQYADEPLPQGRNVQDTLEKQLRGTQNIKRARVECTILDNLTLEVNDLELLVGRYSHSFEKTPERMERMARANLIRKGSGYTASGWDNNATHHRVMDNEKILAVGLKGILQEIDQYLAKIDDGQPDAVQKRAFYLASRMSVEAVCRLAQRYRTLLLSKAEIEKNPIRQSELRQMAENFAHAPYEPCQHFYEAMQTVWLVEFALKALQDTAVTGRLDSYLWPYYQHDLQEGVITPEFALELIEQLYYKHNELHREWPASIMVGGVDGDDKPVWNELSELCIRAIGTTKMVNPSINVAYTKDMPESLLDLCIQQIADGYTRPAFFNDRVIRQGLEDAGISTQDARRYIHSTCVEITPVGCSNVQVATPYINLDKAFEYILNNGDAMYGDPCHVSRPVPISAEQLSTFQGFKDAAKRVAAEIIRTDLMQVCANLYEHVHYASSPLSSALLNDCLERGLDCGTGGCRYSFVYPCFPGYVNFVDTLVAVRKAVYEEKLVTLAQLAQQCQDNFSDERLRQYLLNRCPKFGNDVDESDDIALEIYEMIRSELKKYHTCIGGTFHPSYFAWVMHGEMGRESAATPDGRRQGEALSESLGAMQGRDINGPLAVVRSIAKIPQKYGIGGIATNFRFSKGFMATSEGKQAVKDLIRQFMDSDCFEIQFNVVSQADLLDAQKHPENHRNLLVRIAGYSDYFVSLTPVIQAEIIKRTENEGM